MVNRNLIYFLLLILLVGGVSCSKEDSTKEPAASLNFSFRLVHNGQPINVSSQYLNFSGETYSISRFRFYISNIKLTSLTNQISAEKDSYHLIDLALAGSGDFNSIFNKAVYKSIEFTVGVDSIRNVSGAQTGALDPLNGMFWTWNSGYIFAKLEGISTSSTAPGQAFTYHIGGFKPGENALRKVTLNFPGSSPVNVGQTSQVVISVDVAKWFDDKHTISIAANPSIMTPGGVSLQIADNIAGMFSIEKVINP